MDTCAASYGQSRTKEAYQNTPRQYANPNRGHTKIEFAKQSAHFQTQAKDELIDGTWRSTIRVTVNWKMVKEK